MKTRVLTSVLGGLALALGVAQTAFAQAPHLCVLGASDGKATITPNLTASPNSGTTNFFFTGPCPGTPLHVCSNGTLADASCSGNVTAGQFKLCPTSCDGTPTGGAGALECFHMNNATNPPTKVIDTPTAKGTFNGVCVGALCAGAGSSVQYGLLFDQATTMAALKECPAPPVGSGKGIGTASFGGPIAYEY
jgi:hypothetical protein